jgi:hypothetical protein|tara:strand:- start:135 stop:362 length:228 start_codon:yes stop_codon:yes gene_type:complete
MGNIQDKEKGVDVMQNLYRAVVSMPSDRDARPIGRNTIPLTIEYGGHAWSVNVPLDEFAEAHREMSRVADTDGVE